MRLVSPSGWVIENVEPDVAAWMMAAYDNTHTDIADVEKAKPEDFGK